MSLFKKKHSKIRIPSLKARLLDLDDYLDRHYAFRCEKAYQGWWGKLCALTDREEAEKREKARTDERWWDTSDIFGSCPASLELAIRLATERHARENFSLYLMRLIEAKGVDHVTVYKRANIDRKLFSKIKTNHDYIPSKKTVLALALALELPLEETQALLKQAGFALSHTILSDVIVEYFIMQGVFDMDEINAALYSYDQPIF